MTAPPLKPQESKARRSAARRGAMLTPAMFWCGVLMLAALGFANAVGRFVVEPDVADSPRGKGRELVVIATSQAGWPLPFVAVSGQKAFPLAALEEGIHWISWPALAADLAIGLALAAAGGFLLAAWIKSRRRLMQFVLLDVLLLTGVIGLGLGFGYLPRVEHLEDERTIFDLDIRPGSWTDLQVSRRIVWQPGRMEWLRRMVGETWLPDTGRVVAANVYGGDVRDLSQLDRLRVLRVFGTVTDRELNQLSKLAELECLDLGQANLRRDRGVWVDSAMGTTEFPLALPQLKRLFAPDNMLTGSDLAGCTSLAELDLSGAKLELPDAQTIGQLRRLRILDLRYTPLDDAMLGELAGLPELRMIDLSRTQVTDAGLAHLAALPHLHSVWLANTAVTDAGLAELARCPELESVRLTGSGVTKQGLAGFAVARPDCAIVP